MAAGTKRKKLSSHDEEEVLQQSPFIPMFENYRAELDEHHDRRERTIKASRDVTATSKKIIFSLQRVRRLKAEIPPNIANDINAKFETINQLLSSIRDDLNGINSHRYYRQISPGLQEYIEAISFKYYLEHQSLVTYKEVLNMIPKGINLSDEDYLLGIFDMTGELMRFAITVIATAGQVPTASGSDKSNILVDMQNLRSSIEGLKVPAGSPLNHDWAMKLRTMRTSVEKVENGVYDVIVRGKERPKGWMPDLKANDPDRELEAY